MMKKHTLAAASNVLGSVETNVDVDSARQSQSGLLDKQKPHPAPAMPHKPGGNIGPARP
jgi:hypothetical protein